MRGAFGATFGVEHLRRNSQVLTYLAFGHEAKSIIEFRPPTTGGGVRQLPQTPRLILRGAPVPQIPLLGGCRPLPDPPAKLNIKYRPKANYESKPLLTWGALAA